MTELLKLKSAMNLMNRVIPEEKEKERMMHDLNSLLPPKLSEEFLSTVVQPLKTIMDPEAGKEYIICSYNLDEDSYRSPWTNQYNPPMEYGLMPSEKLRRLEIAANLGFEQYTFLYYGGGVSSVFFCGDDHAFTGAIFIKRTVDGPKNTKGCWESVHIVEIQERLPFLRSSKYMLTSTVTVWMESTMLGSGVMKIGGSTGHLYKKNLHLNEINTHIVNIGEMVEKVENEIRLSLNEIYFRRMNSFVNTLCFRKDFCDSPRKGFNEKVNEKFLLGWNKSKPMVADESEHYSPRSYETTGTGKGIIEDSEDDLESLDI